MSTQAFGPIVKDPARFVETAIDDEIVVMQLDSGEFFSLSGSARAIWEIIDGDRDEASICTALADEFPTVSPSELAADVRGFVARLRAAGLLG
jgi:pyrroloquinoline quinone biosynthesis protein D